MKHIFRFDDVCINADMKLITDITYHMLNNFDCEIIYGVSPMVNNIKGNNIEKQRVFPSIFKAYSNVSKFFEVDEIGIPEMVIDERVKLSGHGLIHCDHRLLSKGAQELSIIASCSLVKAKTFLPPFNKWNKDTEEVCRENGIELIKFEDGWLSMEHNSFNKEHKKWYLHAREWTLDKVKTWFNG